MAWDKQFLSMFPHTVTVQAWNGSYDENGQPLHTGSAIVEYPARVSGKKISSRRVESEGDNQDIFDVWLHATGAVKFTVNDKLTLPDEVVFSENRVPNIFAIGRVSDDDGQHHVKLQCGWRYHRQGQ